MFASREYRNLIAAEKVLMVHIQANEIASKDLAACARVLVAVIDQKRVLRMKPKPKDVDVSKMAKRQRTAHVAASDGKPPFRALDEVA